MPALPAINQAYLLESLVELLQTPSPTGYTKLVTSLVADRLKSLGIVTQVTPKGILTATWNGQNNRKRRALTAHVDTLGAMVKEIKANGRLRLTQIGGYPWNTIEGEGCTVLTSKGSIRGSILLDKASGHVHGDTVGKSERSGETLEIRVDERTCSREDTLNLGIEVGDFVALDPRVEHGDKGFIRSRHLDDKAGVASVIAAISALNEAGLKPSQTVTLHFSNYEEVGHGASAGLPPDLEELVSVDMAAVGEGQASDEFHTTICVKDSGGPYDNGLSLHLRELAAAHSIPFKVDIYPYYGSDGEAYWRAGGDVRVALIGPGVDASHNYERTHMDALVSTAQLVCAYLLS